MATMRFLSLVLLISTFGLQHVVGTGNSETPLLPIEDPFYLPPDGDHWKDLPPGSILKRREVTIAKLFIDKKSKAKAYQLLYSTQDVRGDPDASVTTIIVPVSPNNKRVVSLQSAYDSPDPNCAPSFGLQYGAKGWSQGWNQLNLAFLTPYLQTGPILNIPDYEGSKAAFAVGPQSGYQTLDSIKATMTFAQEEDTEVDKDANVIMVGYSGGGLATEWATELKASYAEDLPIVGAVIGGAPPNVSKVYHNVNEGQFAELDVWAMLGIMNAYPEMDQWMREDLRTDAYQDKRFLLEQYKCTYEKGTLAQSLAGRNISSFFKSGDQFLTEFEPILNEIGVMGQKITEENKPNFPLVFFYGTVDEVTAPIEDTEKLIGKWRDVGACVFEWPLEGKDHSSALIPGMLRAFPWMNTRFWNVENGKTGDCPDAATGFQGQIALEPSHELR